MQLNVTKNNLFHNVPTGHTADETLFIWLAAVETRRWNIEINMFRPLFEIYLDVFLTEFIIPELFL